MSLVFVLLTWMGISVSGQARKITFDDYVREYAQVLTLSRNTASRHLEKTSWFERDKLRSQWNAMQEKDDSGNTRYRIEVKSDGRITIKEALNVDGINYCRVGGGRWLEQECEGEGVALGSLEGEITASYETEKLDSGGKILKASTRIVEVDSNGKPSGRTSFTENKVWISSKGLITKREYISGSEPGKVEHSVFESYDYDAKILPITAPGRKI